MSKEAENIISLINKGILPPINQNETFGINTSTQRSSNKSEIKKQAYEEFAEKVKKLHIHICPMTQQGMDLICLLKNF